MTSKIKVNKNNHKICSLNSYDAKEPNEKAKKEKYNLAFVIIRMIPKKIVFDNLVDIIKKFL